MRCRWCSLQGTRVPVRRDRGCSRLATTRLARLATRLQSGRLDAYMAYMLIAVIAVLAVVTAIT